MAYGNLGGYWGTHGRNHEEAAAARRLEQPALGRVPDPAVVAEKRRMQSMMSDLAHVTPTGELVTFAPEPFGDKIRMLQKEVGPAIDPAAVRGNLALGLAALRAFNPRQP